MRYRGNGSLNNRKSQIKLRDKKLGRIQDKLSRNFVRRSGRKYVRFLAIQDTEAESNQVRIIQKNNTENMTANVSLVTIMEER